MATQTTVTLVCDFCGAENSVETHEVTVDKKGRELEACSKCWAPIAKAHEKAMGAGRPIAKKNGTARRAVPSTPVSTPTAGKPAPKEVRAWAKGQGIEVPDRGRVPESVVEQYRSAMAS